jgi:hypothetical protein
MSLQWVLDAGPIVRSVRSALAAACGMDSAQGRSRVAARAFGPHRQAQGGQPSQWFGGRCFGARAPPSFQSDDRHQSCSATGWYPQAWRTGIPDSRGSVLRHIQQCRLLRIRGACRGTPLLNPVHYRVRSPRPYQADAGAIASPGMLTAGRHRLNELGARDGCAPPLVGSPASRAMTCLQATADAQGSLNSTVESRWRFRCRKG